MYICMLISAINILLIYHQTIFVALLATDISSLIFSYHNLIQVDTCHHFITQIIFVALLATHILA